MSSQSLQELTPQQAEHFVQHGWVKVEDCFTRQQALDVTRDIWIRLGFSPTDKSTWLEDNHMPPQNRWPIRDFSPKAWRALCDLVGGEGAVQNPRKNWNDGFIVNLGTPEGEGKDIPPSNWHVDGQRQKNFLDSSEQGLLTMPIFSDIPHNGGGTMICPAALPILLQHLYDHPEGVMPGFVPAGEGPDGPNQRYLRKLGRNMPPETWVELTGKPGDLYILHPFMLHSRTNNKTRNVRIVTNGFFALKDPFKLYREDPSQYSLVERATLKALGKEDLKGWQITGKREDFAPKNRHGGTPQERARAERERVTAAGHGHIFNKR